MVSWGKRSCLESVTIADRSDCALAAAEMDESSEQMKPLLRTVRTLVPQLTTYP